MDGAEILNLSKGLSGRSAVIEEEATLPFVAGFQNGRPVVTIKSVNDLGGNESTLTLDEAAIVAVTRPETPSQLYLVDDLGNVYEMDKESQNETDYSFRTSAADLGDDSHRCNDSFLYVPPLLRYFLGERAAPGRFPFGT